MNEFDRIFVAESIKAKLGPVSRIDLCGRENVTPMNAFLQVAEESVAQPIALFWIDEGIPAHFTLTGEGSSPVVFHSRHLELCGLIRALYTNESLTALTEDTAARLCLRMLAEFLLAAGFIDQALQCLAKSRLDSGIYMVEPDLTYLEHMPIDERYMCTWFLGLGHEIGHCVRSDVRAALARIPCLSPDRIAVLIDAIVDLYTADADARTTLRSIIAQDLEAPHPNCYASASRVQEEAICDVFSALTVLRASSKILPMIGGTPATTELVQEMLLGFAALTLIEQCRILAEWFHGVAGELKRQNLAMSSIALNARSNILRRALIGAGQGDALEAFLEEDRGMLSELDVDAVDGCARFVADRSIPIHRGLYKARSFLSSAEMRDPEVFYRYAKEVSETPASGMEAARFVRNARLLGRSSPEVDLLAELVRPFLRD